VKTIQSLTPCFDNNLTMGYISSIITKDNLFSSSHFVAIAL